MSINVVTNQNEILDVSLLSFSGGERHIQLPNIQLLPVKSVAITAYIQDSTDVVDLLLIVNALRENLGSNLEISLTLPYLPYSRQDRVCAKGQAFSLSVFANLLATLQLSNLTTWDCHSQVGIDLTGATNVSPEAIIASCPQLVESLNSENSVLVCPDEGAVTRCESIKNYFGMANMVMCNKVRNPKTGKITSTEVNTDSLKGKVAIITDDICDGGYTFIKIAEQLKEKGADKIILFVTHGIFSKGIEVFDGLIDEIYTTNSIKRTFTDAKLTVINN